MRDLTVNSLEAELKDLECRISIKCCLLDAAKKKVFSNLWPFSMTTHSYIKLVTDLFVNSNKDNTTNFLTRQIHTSKTFLYSRHLLSRPGKRPLSYTAFRNLLILVPSIAVDAELWVVVHGLGKQSNGLATRHKPSATLHKALTILVSLWNSLPLSVTCVKPYLITFP